MVGLMKPLLAAALISSLFAFPLGTCNHPVLKCQIGNWGIATCKIVYVPGC